MHCSIAAVRKLALQAVAADADACQLSFVQAVMAAGAKAMCKAMGSLSSALSRLSDSALFASLQAYILGGFYCRIG